MDAKRRTKLWPFRSPHDAHKANAPARPGGPRGHGAADHADVVEAYGPAQFDIELGEVVKGPNLAELQDMVCLYLGSLVEPEVPSRKLSGLEIRDGQARE